MLLVLTLFWRCAVSGLRGCPNTFPFISRFVVFNSRLARLNSRLALQRELARKALIWLAVFTAKWQFRGANRRFIDFWLNLSQIYPRNRSLDQELIVQIPCGTEQGIIFGLSGN